MDRYHEMSVFAAVATELSLAAAARRLALSAPTVTRAIDALEQRIGVALLERSTRGIRLTAAGKRFAGDCNRLLADIAAAEASAVGLHVEARGMLTVAAPLLFGQRFLTPVILDYLDANTAVQVHARFMDRFPNLHEEGVDVAVLVGDLPDSSLFALRIGAIRHVVCASPAYLATYGVPDHPQALRKHRILHSIADARVPEWRFQEKGAAVTVSLRPRLSTATNQAAINAAVAGAGLTRCMSYQIQAQQANGELQCVLEDFETAPLPLQLVYREGRRAAARVRGFVDFAVSRLRADRDLTP